MPAALAIFAHPDDIEFRAAGTLLLLQSRGWDIGYWNLSSGNCGSARLNSQQTARTRRAESQQAAQLLGAKWFPPIARDLEILYSVPMVRRVAAVIRQFSPSILLTHPPVDYMEDHTETCRIVVTAAFAHGMPNFKTTPASAPTQTHPTLYHSMPHGLCDPLGVPVTPHFFVNTATVHDRKIQALAAHQSQQDWLDRSQAMNSYLKAADDDSLELGRRSRKFRYAEAWWQHSHLGFCPPDARPLQDTLGKQIHTPASRSRLSTMPLVP